MKISSDAAAIQKQLKPLAEAVANDRAIPAPDGSITAPELPKQDAAEASFRQRALRTLGQLHQLFKKPVVQNAAPTPKLTGAELATRIYELGDLHTDAITQLKEADGSNATDSQVFLAAYSLGKLDEASQALVGTQAEGVIPKQHLDDIKGRAGP